MVKELQGTMSNNKYKELIKEYGFEYKGYENSVRFGNILDESSKDKKIKLGQMRFPKDWTEDDIYKSGQEILKISDKNKFDIVIFNGNNGISEITEYVDYEEISIGVTINYDIDGDPYVGTIFFDKDIRFNICLSL